MKTLIAMTAALMLATSAQAQFNDIGKKKPDPVAVPTPAAPPVQMPTPAPSPVVPPAVSQPPSTSAASTRAKSHVALPASANPASRPVPVAASSLTYLATMKTVFDEGTAAAATSRRTP